jgi:hypothetical protein
MAQRPTGQDHSILEREEAATKPHLPTSMPNQRREGQQRHADLHPGPQVGAEQLQLQDDDLPRGHRLDAETARSPPLPVAGTAIDPGQHQEGAPQLFDTAVTFLPSRPHRSQQIPDTSSFPLQSPPSVQAPLETAHASAINPPLASQTSTSHFQPDSLNNLHRDQVRSLDSSEPFPPSSGFATPNQHTNNENNRHPKSIRPLAHAVMAFEKGRKFSTGTSVHRKRQMSTLVEKEGQFGPALTVRIPYSHFRESRLVLRDGSRTKVGLYFCSSTFLFMRIEPPNISSCVRSNKAAFLVSVINLVGTKLGDTPQLYPSLHGCVYQHVALTQPLQDALSGYFGCVL